jgi:dynein intermediate chain 2
MDVWDYFYKQNEPCFSTKVCESGLTCLRVQGSGKLVALGGEDGTTTVVELSSGLSDMQHNEKALMTSVFERETRREKNLEVRSVQRQRELKEKQKLENAEHVLFDPAEEDDEKTKEDLKALEDAFYAMIHAGKKTEGEEGAEGEEKGEEKTEEEETKQ